MINEHYTHEAVILANGEYPVHPLPLQVLADAKYVVCCDGAANEYISRGHIPGQQVSIINFGAKGLKGKGLVYPLSDFTNWWQGTLNEAIAEEFSIYCTGEYLVFLVISDYL